MVLELAEGLEAREEGLVQRPPVELRSAAGPGRPWFVFRAEAADRSGPKVRSMWGSWGSLVPWE